LTPLKNMAEPVHVYSLEVAAPAKAKPTKPVEPVTPAAPAAPTPHKGAGYPV
jgi:hypothetical protein